jgi:hypothetical protein
LLVAAGAADGEADVSFEAALKPFEVAARTT